MGDDKLRRTLFGYKSASVREALTEREASLDQASKDAGAAEQRAEGLSSELSGTQARLAGVEEQLETLQKLNERLTADLERAVARRESLETEVPPLRREIEEVRTELREAKEAINGRDAQLRAAAGESARLAEQLQALDESGGVEASMSAQQARIAELEELVAGYRELIDGRIIPPAPSADPSDAQEPPTPSTASELAAVIEVAEQAVANIMESTRVRADEELRSVDEEREQIKRDVETMTAWRDRAAPMIASLQAAMQEIRNQGAELGLRVNEALRPVSTAVTALNQQIASLNDLAGAPLDVSPEAPARSEPDRVTKLP